MQPHQPDAWGHHHHHPTPAPRDAELGYTTTDDPDDPWPTTLTERLDTRIHQPCRPRIRSILTALADLAQAWHLR